MCCWSQATPRSCPPPPTPSYETDHYAGDACDSAALTTATQLPGDPLLNTFGHTYSTDDNPRKASCDVYAGQYCDNAGLVVDTTECGYSDDNEFAAVEFVGNGAPQLGVTRVMACKCPPGTPQGLCEDP